MNTDIRISVGIVNHPKTVKLMRRCGDRAFFSIISLWTWAAQYRPDGVLTGLDKEDIEIASAWQGESGKFFNELIALKFVEESEGVFLLHDWAEHNSWAAKADERSGQARFSRLAKVNPEIYTELKNKGISTISKEEYERLINDRLTTVNASLTPAPAPAPKQKDLKDSCAEPSAIAEPQRHKPMPFITLPLNDKTEYPIYYGMIEEWKNLFPKVDIEQELREIRAWNISHTTQRKTKTGIMKHITGWLAKEQDKGGRNGAGNQTGGILKA